MGSPGISLLLLLLLLSLLAELPPARATDAAEVEGDRQILNEESSRLQHQQPASSLPFQGASSAFPRAALPGRPGYCPALPIPSSSPYNAKRCNRCEQDADCPEGKKCCGSSCGNTCQTPETDLCKLPPETGPCRASFRMFYYNWRNKRCEIFTYGGCFGNANRFNTLELCQLACGNSGAL